MRKITCIGGEERPYSLLALEDSQQRYCLFWCRIATLPALSLDIFVLACFVRRLFVTLRPDVGCTVE